MINYDLQLSYHEHHALISIAASPSAPTAHGAKFDPSATDPRRRLALQISQCELHQKSVVIIFDIVSFLGRLPVERKNLCREDDMIAYAAQQ